jgi:hypothetical protein
MWSPMNRCAESSNLQSLSMQVLYTCLIGALVAPVSYVFALKYAWGPALLSKGGIRRAVIGSDSKADKSSTCCSVSLSSSRP